MKANEKRPNNASKCFAHSLQFTTECFSFRLIFNELLNTERAYVDSLSKCIQVSLTFVLREKEKIRHLVAVLYG